jgi:Ca-activated chloride channel family protein
VSVPTSQTAIILAMDVSRSMRAADIPPSRIEAAQNAALSFIQSQKPGTQIGIVAFAGFAEMVHPPTTDQQALEAAVESLTLGRGTAIGSGLLKAIDVIAEIDPSVAPSVTDSSPGFAPTPVPNGAYAPDIIVLLTDGVATTGPPPLDAAQQAVDRGVRVYTIGFGTDMGSAQFGGQPSGGGGFRRGIDEETLKEIAAMTGGTYYEASSASELLDVFESLPTYLITRHEVTEISVAFTAVGVLFAALAIGLALLWNPLS